VALFIGVFAAAESRYPCVFDAMVGVKYSARPSFCSGVVVLAAIGRRKNAIMAVTKSA